MDIKNNLNELYNQIYDNLKKAVNNEDIKGIEKYSELLPQAKSLLNELEIVEEQTEILLRKLIQGENKNELTRNNFIHDFKPSLFSTREVARGKRNDFLNKLNEKGINLIQYSGVIYTDNQKSDLIGIAFSGEQGNRWLLGLPIKNYSIIVLLCSNIKNEYDAIILPKDFCNKITPYLSSSGNQFKFSVRKYENGETTIYTRMGNLSVTQFVNNYDPFLKNDI